MDGGNHDVRFDSKSVRHIGQLVDVSRHRTRQCEWKAWPQATVTRVGPSSRQTGHCSPPSSSETTAARLSASRHSRRFAIGRHTSRTSA